MDAPTGDGLSDAAVKDALDALPDQQEATAIRNMLKAHNLMLAALVELGVAKLADAPEPDSEISTDAVQVRDTGDNDGERSDYPARKRRSEFSASSVMTYFLLLQQDQLDSKAAVSECEEHDFHIYMIFSAPRVSVGADTFEWSNGRLHIDFHVHEKGQIKIVSFDRAASSNVLESKYPHTECVIRDADRYFVMGGKTLLVMNQFCPGAVPLEVLYVGQAYGRSGDRSASDRIRHHETLQKIYMEASCQRPDREIWIGLAEFRPEIMMVSDGSKPASYFQTTEDEDNDHLRNVTGGFPDHQVIINFTEAALIRYFQPHYNVHYKSTFPSSAHASYRACYEIDLHSLSVDLDFSAVGFDVGSPSVPARSSHIVFNNLHDEDERRSMLDDVFGDALRS